MRGLLFSFSLDSIPTMCYSGGDLRAIQLSHVSAHIANYSVLPLKQSNCSVYHSTVARKGNINLFLLHKKQIKESYNSYRELYNETIVHFALSKFCDSLMRMVIYYLLHIFL